MVFGVYLGEHFFVFFLKMGDRVKILDPTGKT